MMQEAARAELVMLKSRAVLASSTAPFRSFRSFLSRTCGPEEGRCLRGPANTGASGPQHPGMLCFLGNFLKSKTI